MGFDTKTGNVSLFDVRGTADRILQECGGGENGDWAKGLDRLQLCEYVDGVNLCGVNTAIVPQLSADLAAVVGELVAKVINAGSERDAVEETLTPVLEEELNGWSLQNALGGEEDSGGAVKQGLL